MYIAFLTIIPGHALSGVRVQKVQRVQRVVVAAGAAIYSQRYVLPPPCLPGGKGAGFVGGRQTTENPATRFPPGRRGTA